MNILYCNHLRVRSLVGEAIHIYEVISHLARMGHDIVSLGGDLLRNQAGTEANLRIPVWRRIEIRLLQWPVFRPFRSELSVLGIFRHEVYIFLSTLIVIIRRKRRVDVIYRRHTVFNSEYLLAKLFKIPSVKEVNGILADEMRITKRGDRVSLWVVGKIERFNMPKADKIIVVTAKLKKVLQEDYAVSEDKIAVIPNGANTDLFKPMDVAKAKAELGLKRGDNYICFVGTLERWQGVDYLIKSIPSVLEQCPETRLLVVGDGKVKQELIELSRQTGVSDRVVFTGMVPYKEVPLYVNAVDICTSPKTGLRSGYSPLKLCEYMACGKPVVASRASGLEIVEDSGGGILVEPKDPQALAAAITKLLQNRELRKRMGEKGRKYVVENQSWESVAKKVADVCQSLIDARSYQGEQ
jgi:glycosyltransferase involved in cell wall biosynthesis